MSMAGHADAASLTPPVPSPLSLTVSEGPVDAGIAPPAGLNWYKFANHTHTKPYSSDGRCTVAQRIAGAGTEGADCVSITDHGNCDAYYDPDFKETNGCIPMNGLEWGSDIDGDAGLLNLTPGPPVGGSVVEQMIPLALARGATIIANHPFIYNEPWIHEDLHQGITGIEIWTMAIITPEFTHYDDAIAWWHGLIAKGRIITGIGGSDNHDPMLSNLKPCNHILAVSPQPDDIQDAVEAGRITLSSTPAAGRCFLWCDVDGDALFETYMGQNVAAPPAGTLRFRVEVYDAEGTTLKLYNAAGLVNTYIVGVGAPWTLDAVAGVTGDTKDFVRAELYYANQPLNPLMAVTNPIYVHYTPGDADSDGLPDGLEISIGSDHYNADTDGDGVSDGFEAGYDGDPAHYDPFDATTNPDGGDLDLFEPDTDFDGVSDGQELIFGRDPANPLDTPSFPLSALPLALVLGWLAKRRLRR